MSPRSAAVPPLLVADGIDLKVFRSEEALAGQLEPWFLEHEHHAWDGLGRPLELVVIDPPGSGFLRRLLEGTPFVGVRPADAGPDCSSYLRGWLFDAGGPQMPSSASLPELLVQCLLRAELV